MSYGQNKIKLNNQKAQLFDLDTISYKLIKGINGTEIYFVREDFEVSSNQKITLELKEYSNSSYFIFIDVKTNGQRLGLKKNRRIPMKIRNKNLMRCKIYYSKFGNNNSFNWIGQTKYSGVMSFDEEWQIDVLKAVRSDSINYYNYTDIDRVEHSSLIYPIMIDKLGWFKIE
ncbi:MAG: hypothetical protein RIM83_17125 [Allomuricauda sp.]